MPPLSSERRRLATWNWVAYLLVVPSNTGGSFRNAQLLLVHLQSSTSDFGRNSVNFMGKMFFFQNNKARIIYVYYIMSKQSLILPALVLDELLPVHLHEAATFLGISCRRRQWVWSPVHLRPSSTLISVSILISKSLSVTNSIRIRGDKTTQAGDRTCLIPDHRQSG